MLRQTVRLVFAAMLCCLMAARAQALPFAGFYNTGVDSSGATLDNNMRETHYTLINVPSGATDLRVATSANGYPVDPWAGDDGASGWIGPVSDLYMTGPAGTYDYQTSFDLSGYDALSAILTGQWGADNHGIDILLNGVSTGNTTVDGGIHYSGFEALSNFAITSGFADGINTLDFIIFNDGPLASPTGLRVEGDLTAIAATGIGAPVDLGSNPGPDPEAVSEPDSLLIMLAGLFGMELLRRRGRA